MGSKESEYKEIFLAESRDSHQDINRLLTVLEKDTTHKETIDSLFRITHTLKGNALGMGFTKIGEVSHSLEDFLGSLRMANSR